MTRITSDDKKIKLDIDIVLKVLFTIAVIIGLLIAIFDPFDFSGVANTSETSQDLVGATNLKHVYPGTIFGGVFAGNPGLYADDWFICRVEKANKKSLRLEDCYWLNEDTTTPTPAPIITPGTPVPPIPYP